MLYRNPSTIEEVIARLENIIQDAARTGDRLGYFAVLYYKVTCRVKEGIDNGEFDNGARMERLDVIFASRYLEAYARWKNKELPTLSWKTAFEAASHASVLVLQHLLLGMNAHINLDLGIAVVEVADGTPLEMLHKDFNMINTIIASLTYEVLSEVTQVSPLLSLLGLHAANASSILIQFSIDNARDGAWCFAEELAEKKDKAYDDCIQSRDKTIQQLAQELVYVKGLIRLTVWLVHLFEWRNPAKIIKVLQKYQKQKLAYHLN